MHISDAGLNLIKSSEGFVNHVYPDNGKPATGYGHNLQPGESYPNAISEDQATALLRPDCAYAEHAVSTLVTAPIGQKQQQFDALATGAISRLPPSPPGPFLVAHTHFPCARERGRPELRPGSAAGSRGRPAATASKNQAAPRMPVWAEPPGCASWTERVVSSLPGASCRIDIHAQFETDQRTGC